MASGEKKMAWDWLKYGGRNWNWPAESTLLLLLLLLPPQHAKPGFSVRSTTIPGMAKTCKAVGQLVV